MAEPDNELERLHAADPVERSSLPSATDPTARDLFERIIMHEPETTTAARSPRRRLVLAAAAAAAVVGLAAGAVAISRGGDDAPKRAAATTTTADTAGGPITPGGPSGASCVETYAPATLARRQVAFEGTVERVAGDAITFNVNRWYRGGRGAAVTLGGASTLGGLTSAGPGLSLEPGTRLLVAGDGGFAWSCGFTQAYDAAVAQQWADTFAG